MLPPFNKKNRNVYVNINGRLIHRRRARISPFDAVVQAGDAVWEGMRVYEGHVYRVVDHVDRIRQGAELLGFNEIPSRPWLIGQIKRTLVDNEMYDGVHLRITVSRGIKVSAGLDPALNKYGPTVLIVPEFKEIIEVDQGLKMIIGSVRWAPPEFANPALHHCSMLAQVIARTEANAAEVDDAILLDTDGNITEATESSFFIVKDGAIAAAPPCPGNEQTTRTAIVELCESNGVKFEERTLSPDDVAAADEVFISDTLNEVSGIIEFDGKPVGDGEVGEVTRRMADLYHELASTTGTKLVEPEEDDADDDEEYEDDDEYED